MYNVIIIPVQTYSVQLTHRDTDTSVRTATATVVVVQRELINLNDFDVLSIDGGTF